MKKVVFSLIAGLIFGFYSMWYIQQYHFVKLSTGWHRVPKEQPGLSLTLVNSQEEGFKDRFFDLPGNLQIYILKHETKAITERFQSGVKKWSEDLLKSARETLNEVEAKLK